MKCAKPYYLKTQGIFVPCGRCRPCRINRAAEWATRITHEAQSHEHNAFITLTYDDEHAPGELIKRDLQLFLKRIRKNTNKKLKYYACGEYGEQTGREHFHLIIFGLETCGKCRVCTKLYRLRGKLPEQGTDCHELEKSWTKGMIHAGTVTPASARYVADYLQKQPPSDGRPPAFSLMSQGIGKEWLTSNIDLQTCYRGLNKGTSRAPVPRYYQKQVIKNSGEFPEIPEFLIKMVKLRKQLEHQDKLKEFWKQRNKGFIEAQIKAGIHTEHELATRQRYKEAPL